MAHVGIAWMQAVFYGVGAAVIGIIAISAHKLATRSIGRDKLLWAIYLVSAIVTIVMQSEIVWLFLGAGALVWLVTAPRLSSDASTSDTCASRINTPA